MSFEDKLETRFNEIMSQLNLLKLEKLTLFVTDKVKASSRIVHGKTRRVGEARPSAWPRLGDTAADRELTQFETTI